MTDRQDTIDRAIRALEDGTATPPDGQDPDAAADQLREATERGGLSAYAAYKAAQRVLK